MLIFNTVGNFVGGAGDLYPSLIQAILPRLLYAAAPPGNSAWENRRQCLKASAFNSLIRIYAMYSVLFSPLTSFLFDH